jgi:hypothetical protein
MYVNPNNLDSWEALIGTIDKSDIPVQFVNSVQISYHDAVDGKSNQDIDIKQLRENGWTNDLIEEILSHTVEEHGNNIKTISFLLDVAYVASTIQKQTNFFLEGI